MGESQCEHCIVEGQKRSQWTCPCGYGYWDAANQKFVPGSRVRNGEAQTRAEYEAHLRKCAQCNAKAEQDDLVLPTRDEPWDGRKYGYDNAWGPHARPFVEHGYDRSKRSTSPKQIESFLPNGEIDFKVIKDSIKKYLGPNASVHVAKNMQGTEGYLIRSGIVPTRQIILELKYRSQQLAGRTPKQGITNQNSVRDLEDNEDPSMTEPSANSAIPRTTRNTRSASDSKSALDRRDYALRDSGEERPGSIRPLDPRSPQTLKPEPNYSSSYSGSVGKEPRSGSYGRDLADDPENENHQHQSQSRAEQDLAYKVQSMQFPQQDVILEGEDTAIDRRASGRHRQDSRYNRVNLQEDGEALMVQRPNLANTRDLDCDRTNDRRDRPNQSYEGESAKDPRASTSMRRYSTSDQHIPRRDQHGVIYGRESMVDHQTTTSKPQDFTSNQHKPRHEQYTNYDNHRAKPTIPEYGNRDTSRALVNDPTLSHTQPVGNATITREQARKEVAQKLKDEGRVHVAVREFDKLVDQYINAYRR